MDRLLQNRLLLASLGAFALYWIIGLSLPGKFISVAVAVALFTFGALTFYQYTPSAYRILFRQERSDHAKGSHLAAYGVWLIAAGAVWSGTFSVLWHWYSQPETWLSTPWSGFGRAMISGGFFLMYIAPEEAAEGIRINAPLWIAAAIATGLALGTVIGFQWTQPTQLDPWRFVGNRADNNPVSLQVTRFGSPRGPESITLRNPLGMDW